MVWLRCSKESSESQNTYRLVVTVLEADGIDDSVFLYLALPQRENATDRVAIFQGVCSPKDMVDVPIDEPYENAEPPWLRHNTVDLLLPSRYEADEAWRLIQEELIQLTSTFESLEQLGESVVVTFGDQESEESESESAP